MEVLWNLYLGEHPRGLGSLRALPNRRNPSVPLIGPGARLLTRMFWGPHSTAKCRVIASAWKAGRYEGECRAALPSGVAWVEVGTQGQGWTSPLPTQTLLAYRDRQERDPKEPRRADQMRYRTHGRFGRACMHLEHLSPGTQGCGDVHDYSSMILKHMAGTEGWCCQ